MTRTYTVTVYKLIPFVKQIELDAESADAAVALARDQADAPGLHRGRGFLLL